MISCLVYERSILIAVIHSFVLIISVLTLGILDKYPSYKDPRVSNKFLANCCEIVLEPLGLNKSIEAKYI